MRPGRAEGGGVKHVDGSHSLMLGMITSSSTVSSEQVSLSLSRSEILVL